ncbi:hypothetical protein I5907_04045 [Panacibacter sp. DH6]|uniref:Glycosyl hydrolases family 28 n=1 Tax=Panacibacter microcysteis TaxID=2793269 RepID=A0A931E7Y9_9BACT|nr:glycosyl hydrolase family 28 protein [Panacibacter microcysteis]MBG9375391.1 hypothetical protein [Panacibacter microcysteis]
MKTLMLLCTLVLTITCHSQDVFINYPAPEGIQPAPDYQLEINGQKVFVYNTRSAAYAYCSFSGQLHVTVTPSAKVYYYTIRPLSRNISASANNNQVSFILTKPAHLSIEINGNKRRPLFLFADSLEQHIPDSTQKNVTYYGPGIHKVGNVPVKSNQLVYIAGGAVVEGAFDISNAQNVQVKGRGILDNSSYKKGEARPVAITNSQHVNIEGIIIAESRHWTCGSYSNNNVHYNNLKVVSDNDWDDGIDIVASAYITISNCFIRTKDDCIAIKSGVDYFGKANHRTTANINVSNCIFWNGAWGNALEIGFETSTDTIQDIRFSDCDIIHAEGPEGTLTIHNGDRAFIKNIYYNNIRIEEVEGYLVDFKILFSQYSTDKQRGFISNIFLDNITVNSQRFPTSLLLGFNDTNNISNIHIRDLRINGKHINSAFDGMMTAMHCKDLVFE